MADGYFQGGHYRSSRTRIKSCGDVPERTRLSALTWRGYVVTGLMLLAAVCGLIVLAASLID